MSQLLVAGGLRQAFRSSTHTAAALKLFARQQEEERLRRERKEDLRDDAADLADFAMVAISETEIREFRFELDQYDTATIAALQQNESELSLSRERLETLFGKAYVLPDGRRAFKTEDGQVFDEFGNEVPEDVILASEIEDFRPRWEEVQPQIAHHNKLLQQRTELLGYQDKLDDARERLDAGDLTRDEFDELRDTLKAEMPDAVRAQIPGMESEQKPQVSADADPLAAELDITDDMVPSALASRAVAPTFGG
jgi:hypothetical protein